MLDFATAPELMVFGGPYSNLWATEALRAEAERRGIRPEHVICTGDVVAYCSEPEATTRAIVDWGCHVVAGNCEQQLAAGADDCGCGFEDGTACDLLAKGWYPFAAARISADSRRWMADLPASLRFRFAGLSFRVVHGGVAVSNRFLFASDAAAVAAEWSQADADVVIAGHCGIPFAVRTAHAGRRGLWFNPGVIGMPANDGTPDAWYGLLRADAGGLVVSTHRLTYDHRAAAAAMRRHTYADGYARALVTGLWPSQDILPAAECAATGVRLRSTTLRLVASATPSPPGSAPAPQPDRAARRTARAR